MTPEQARAWVTHRLGAPTSGATRLPGGLLNHVHRVGLTGGGHVVVKHAPPHVASAPHIPLDPGRSRVEARALRHLAGGPVPRVLDHHGATLVLEDVGDLPDLTAWLAAGGDPAVLDRLGRWLRALHDGPAPAIDNRAVQTTRREVQYRAAAGWLRALGLPDADRLGAILDALGARFEAGGPVFVMGDLWPPSVRVRPDGRFVVLDWELATRGHRAQDLGHLTAHLHLEAVAGPLPADLGPRFLAAYGPVDAVTAREIALHGAAERLARTVGAFPREGLTEGARRALVDAAVALLRGATPPT